MEVKKNQTYELFIESADRNGSGVGRLNGMAVFVPYALPGERVRALIIKTAKRYAVGKLTEVLQASPARVQPVCPYFLRCGGCTMQHMEYRQQLEIKRAQTEETLRRISHLPVSVETCIGMEEPYLYRNKAQFPVGTDAFGRPIFGFFSPHSHRIIDIDKCAIQQMNVNKAFLTVRRIAERMNVSVYNDKSIRAFCARCDSAIAENRKADGRFGGQCQTSAEGGRVGSSALRGASGAGEPVFLQQYGAGQYRAFAAV